MEIWVNTYSNHPGSESAPQPSSSSIWLASGSGADTAKYEKMMVSGSYWVVIMNVDGSSGLNVDLQVSGTMPLMLGLPSTLVILGIISAIVGFISYPRKK